MGRALYVSLALALSSAAAAAVPVDVRAPAGRFEDCELLDLGPSGSISGTMSLRDVKPTANWASVLAIILVDDAKFQTSFRFGLASVTTSPNLEARYEFFAGSRRPVAEGLTHAGVGTAMAFRLSWNESGVVEISAGPSQQRRLLLDFNPTRAFLLVSGGQGHLELEGSKGIDCSLDLLKQGR